MYHLQILYDNLEAVSSNHFYNHRILGISSRGNFSGSNFAFCFLLSFDFSRAKLTGANLNGTRLIKANLTVADLFGQN